jgi:cytoskeletal protein CcmA (bactofilin family)
MTPSCPKPVTKPNPPGHKAAAAMSSPGFDDDEDFSARRPSPAYSDVGDDPQHEPKNILEDVPETTIGENVSVNGTLAFDKLLRIDGSFNGQLESEGDLIIGRSGTLIGNVAGMGELIIDGKVQGNLSANKIELRAKASVFGDIVCKSLTMDPTCVVVGKMNVNPFAPGEIGMDLKAIIKEESAAEPAAAPAAEPAAAPAAEAPAAEEAVPEEAAAPAAEEAAPAEDAKEEGKEE